MKARFVLSPCGTSLLTNQAAKDQKGLVFRHANAKNQDEVDAGDRQILRDLIAQVAGALEKADAETAMRMSAELNGIVSIYGGQIPRGGDFHYLLSTDTWLGEETARLVQGWLESHGLTAFVDRHEDLQTAQLWYFQHSLSALVKKFSDTIPEYSQKGYRIIFNLTGGFKSVQGFLQSIANFYADETVYIFETSSELLKIPRLPVKMQAGAIVRDQVAQFRKLALGMEVSPEALKDIPEILLLRMEGQAVLSPWGELVWEQAKAELYREKLLPPPVDKIKYSNAFEKEVAQLPPERKELVNKRIDQLARYFLSAGRYNPASLDFKLLQGKPLELSTHELDAWSDKDARRIFGHYENGIFFLDSLAKGLH